MNLFLKNNLNIFILQFFFLYCIISLMITFYLLIFIYKFKLFTNLENDLLILNYKICFMKGTVLIISLICLILFRYSLTEKSETSCLIYFIFYLFNTLVCLIVLSINIKYLHVLIISLELLTISFYTLSCYNYSNFAYLIFRPIHKRKLLYISSVFGILGLFLFESHFYIWSLYLSKQMYSYSYFLMLFANNKYVLVTSVLFLTSNILLKLVTFHSPTHYIYYQKTPLITIVYMHLIPKIIFFYFLIDLLFTNFYFIISEYYLNLLIISASLFCLIIGIGMRRLFLKHSLEYLGLVNTGYLLLCLTPLTFKSVDYCISILFFYILIILFYGGIVLFFDNELNPGKRISFDIIFSDIDQKDYFTIGLSLVIFSFFGMPPTRRDYPCSRGIPFNGFIIQWLLVKSLLDAKSYLILIPLIIFNFILFLFYIWTVFPFWDERKYNKFDSFPKYLNLFIIEFATLYSIFTILTLILLQLNSNFITNFIQTFSI